MSFLLLCFIFCFLLTKSAFYPKTSGVINLDADNFDKVVGANEDEVQIIEFYAPWCGHCKQLQPEYIKLAKQVKNIVKVYAVDANEDKNKQLAARFGVQGFPTLKVQIGSNKPEDYQGQRTAAAMKSYVLSKLPNYAKKVKKDKLDKFLSIKPELPHGLILSKKSTTSSTVKRLSALLKNHMIIGESLKGDSNIYANKYGISVKDGSQLIVFEPKSDINAKPQVFSGNTKSFRAVQEFLYTFTPGLELDGNEKLPYLLDHSCYKEKCEKKGLCVILINGEDKSDNSKAHGILREVEETSDDASLFSFSQIDASKEYEWLNKLFGSLDTYYSNIIVLAPQKKRYAHYVGSVSYNAIKGFISGILKGKTRTSKLLNNDIPTLSTDTEYCKPKPKPKPKSKPRQQQSSSGGSGGHAPPGGGSKYIMKLDNSNFDQVVYGNNQPVIVEFYAPWCGHCKQFAPEYAKAATNLKGMVIFGSVDCDNNKNKPICGKFNIKGFPTVKVFGVGRENKMKNGASDYQGARTARDLEKAGVNKLYSIKIPVISSEDDYNEFIGDNEPFGKILLISEKKKPPTLLRALAAAFDRVSFAMINKEQESLIEKLGVTEFPLIVGYGSDTSQGGKKYQGTKDFPSIFKFILDLIKDKLKEAQAEQEQEGKYDL